MGTITDCLSKSKFSEKRKNEILDYYYELMDNGLDDNAAAMEALTKFLQDEYDFLDTIKKQLNVPIKTEEQIAQERQANREKELTIIQRKKDIELDKVKKPTISQKPEIGSKQLDENATEEDIQDFINKHKSDGLARFVKKHLIDKYDYLQTKEGIQLGFATSLSSPHSIYSKEFCEQFQKIIANPDVSPDDVLRVVKTFFFPAYKDLAETLQENGYKVPNAYFNALSSKARKKKIAELAAAKAQASEKEKELVAKAIEKYEKKEQKIVANEPDYIPISHYLRKVLENYTAVDDISDLVEENGVLNDIGKRVKEQSAKIINTHKKELGKFKGLLFGDIKNNYSQGINSNYYNPEDITEWNPVYEAFFFAYHLMNADMAKMTKGSTFFTKNLVDFVKRSAGESAPGTKVDVTIETGLPRMIKNLVVNFGGDVHPWSTEFVDGKSRLKNYGNLRSDGQGMLNPLMGVLLQNSAGPEYGPVGNSMIKNVLHYHDFEQNNTIYLKQALRKITGDTIRMSAQDFTMMKLMNQAIWDMNFLDGLTYGQAFENYRNGSDKYSFEQIVQHAVKAINANPSLKNQIAFQVIDPSAVKTGLTAVHELDDLIDDEGNLVTLGDEDYLIADASQMRIQLNVEKDIYETKKNLPIQILNLIGVIPGNEGTYQKIHGSIASIVDQFTNSNIAVNGTKDVQSESFIRNVVARSIGGDAQRKVISAVNNKGVTLSVIRAKAVSALVSYVNNFVKPTMSGNSFAQGTCKIEVWRDEDGNIYTGRDAINQQVNGKNLTSTELKPMRFEYQGKELVHNDNDPVEAQVERYSKDPETAKDLKVVPAEVVMPYPYMDEFGLNPNMTIEEARSFIRTKTPERLAEFEKSLDIFFLRIPTSNASAGSIARIVGFVQDSGNTILIPHQKNAIDGSDQDIDMLHVFFRTMNTEKSKVDESPEFLSKLSRANLQNNIFEGIHEFYSNVNNYSMTFKANDMDSLRIKAEEADREDRQDIPSDGTPPRNMDLANMASSEQRQSEINHDGKSVGYFANMGAFIGKLLSIHNQNVNGTDSFFNPYFKLLNYPVSKISSAIDFISKLVNAATDNAKENILGRLNINDRTASLISGMVMLGYDEDRIISVLRSSVIREASRDIRLTQDLDQYAVKMYDILDKRDDQLRGMSNEDLITEFQSTFGYKASSIYDVTEKVIDLVNSKIFTIVPENETEEDAAQRELMNGILQEYFIHTIKNVVLIGDGITRIGMMTDITKELPTSANELRAKLYSIEEILGTTADKFINGFNPTVEEQIEFNKNRMTSDRGYLKGAKEQNYEKMELFMRNPQNTMNIHLIARSYPNFMSTLKLLNGLVNHALPNAFYIDKAYSEGLMETLKEQNGIGLVMNEQRLGQIDAAINKYVIGKFLSNITEEEATIRLGSVNGKDYVYDLRDPIQRVKFGYSYANLISSLKESDDKQIAENSFISMVSVDKTFDTAFPIIKLNLPYDVQAGIITNLNRQIIDVGKRLGKDFDFVKATEFYNLLMYGHGGMKGSMNNVIGTRTEELFTKWLKDNENTLYSNTDDFMNTLRALTPQNVTLKNNHGNGFSHTIFSKERWNKSIRKRFGVLLFKDSKSVDNIHSSEVNTFGSNKMLLATTNEIVTLSLNDMISMINNNGWVEVTGFKNKLVPGDLMKNVKPEQTAEGNLYRVAFPAYIPTGEQVRVIAYADQNGYYKNYRVELSDTQVDQITNEIYKDDNVACK